MQLENAFEVPAPPDQAWQLLTDVPRVVPCMPGAQVTEVVDADTFKVAMKVKLGPIGLEFASDVRRESTDEAARRTTLVVKARELKGRGGAVASIQSTLEPAGAGTRVTIVTELQLQGAVASQGRGIVGDVANQLVGRFADCLAGQLQDSSTTDDAATDARPPGQKTPEPEPLGGGSLVLRALFRPVLRLFGRR